MPSSPTRLSLDVSSTSIRGTLWSSSRSTSSSLPDSPRPAYTLVDDLCVPLLSDTDHNLFPHPDARPSATTLPSDIGQAVTLTSLFVALDTLFATFASTHHFHTLTSLCGTISPLSTAIPPSLISALHNLHPSAPLSVQLPLSHRVHTLLDPPPSSGPNHLETYTSVDDLNNDVGDETTIPIGYLLTSLFLQSPGSTMAQEPHFASLLLTPPDRISTCHTPSEPLGIIGSYWVERYGLCPNCQVYPFVPAALAARASVDAKSTDLVIFMDDAGVDHYILPLSSPPLSSTQPTTALPASASLTPNQQLVDRQECTATAMSHPLVSVPSLDGGSVGIMVDVNGATARRAVRDEHGNGKWSVSSHLALLFPPGASLSLDDKHYLFHWPHGINTSHGVSPCLARFEYGARVEQFRDLRANTRCLIESQLFALRHLVTQTRSDFDRIIVLGSEARENVAFAHIASQMFARPVYISTHIHPTSLGSVLSTTSDQFLSRSESNLDLPMPLGSGTQAQNEQDPRWTGDSETSSSPPSTLPSSSSSSTSSSSAASLSSSRSSTPPLSKTPEEICATDERYARTPRPTPVRLPSDSTVIGDVADIPAELGNLSHSHSCTQDRRQSLRHRITQTGLITPPPSSPISPVVPTLEFFETTTPPATPKSSRSALDGGYGSTPDTSTARETRRTTPARKVTFVLDSPPSSERGCGWRGPSNERVQQEEQGEEEREDALVMVAEAGDEWTKMVYDAMQVEWERLLSVVERGLA